MDKQFLVEGHSIPYSGHYFNPRTSQEENGPGSTRCSCGVESPILPSTYARREWGIQHKKEILSTGGAVESPGPIPVPKYQPASASTITKKCRMSSTVCEQVLDPTFDKSNHVTCPECHRTLHIREDSNLYPTHYQHISPTRDHEISKTRLRPIPGLFYIGAGSAWKSDREPVNPGRHQVWRLTYNKRSYQVWRESEDRMWSISPDDDAAFVDKTILACGWPLNDLRGIVVDWGVGGSVYEDYNFKPPRDRW